MKIKPNQTRAINRFEKAIRNHDNMGAQPPEDHEQIEYEYELSMRLLKLQFMRLNSILEK